MRILGTGLCTLTLILFTGYSQATLIDRGGGLVYDDVLDITWLKDANYAATSGHSSTGKMNWLEATDWVSNLEFYDSVRGVIWDDWRLPSTVNNLAWIRGVFDVTGENSELAHMFYNNLGYEANLTLDPSTPNPSSNLANPFENLVFLGQWSSTTPGIPERDWAWGMHYHFGLTTVTSIYDSSYAWAVRDGDVASISVPEPNGILLFAAGILALLGSRRLLDRPLEAFPV